VVIPAELMTRIDEALDGVIVRDAGQTAARAPQGRPS
jgi:hypothetical protein